MSDYNKLFDETARMRGAAAFGRALRDWADVSDRHLAELAERGKHLVLELADRVGGPVITENPDGRVFTHPELARELQKPENAEFVEMLLAGFARKSAPCPACSTQRSRLCPLLPRTSEAEAKPPPGNRSILAAGARSAAKSVR